MVETDEVVAVIELGGAIGVAGGIPAIAGVSEEGKDAARGCEHVFRDALAVAAGGLVESGGIAALRVKKAIFGVLELLDAAVALSHQEGLVGVSHVVHHVDALVDGVPDALLAVGAVALIHGAQVVQFRDAGGHFVLVITAPGEGVVVQVFSEHDGGVVAERGISGVVLDFADDVFKLGLGLGGKASDMHFRQHVHLVLRFAPDVVSIGVPVSIQIAEIEVGRHSEINRVAHLAVAAAQGHDLVIAAQDHILQRLGGACPGLIGVADEGAHLGGVVGSGIAGIDIRGLEYAGADVVAVTPVGIALQPGGGGGVGNDDHLARSGKVNQAALGSVVPIAGSLLVAGQGLGVEGKSFHRAGSQGGGVEVGLLGGQGIIPSGFYLDAEFGSRVNLAGNRIVFPGEEVQHGILEAALQLGAQITVIGGREQRVALPDRGIGLSSVRTGLRSGLLLARVVQIHAIALQQVRGALHAHVEHLFPKGDQHPHGVIVERGNAGFQQGCRGLAAQAAIPGGGVNAYIEGERQADSAEQRQANQGGKFFHNLYSILVYLNIVEKFLCEKWQIQSSSFLRAKKTGVRAAFVICAYLRKTRDMNQSLEYCCPGNFSPQWVPHAVYREPDKT